MRSTDYAYAVARVRAMENALLTRQELEQLAAAPGPEQALRRLCDRGWGDGSAEGEAVFSAEYRKAWETVRELAPDFSAFTPMLLKNDYHNLKAAIKCAYTDRDPSGLMLEPGSVPAETICAAVASRRYGALPEAMAQAAPHAFDLLARTGDGRLCDAALDRAGSEDALRHARAYGDRFMTAYAALTLDLANVKTALRCAKYGKSAAFCDDCLARGGTLDPAELSAAAAAGEAEVLELLSHTDFSGAAEAWTASPSAFERWCDDRVMQLAKTARYEAFGLAPLAAYLIARQTEIQSARILVLGLGIGLGMEQLGTRLRELYAS